MALGASGFWLAAWVQVRQSGALWDKTARPPGPPPLQVIIEEGNEEWEEEEEEAGEAAHTSPVSILKVGDAGAA
jgi:hypothetical protein